MVENIPRSKDFMDMNGKERKRISLRQLHGQVVSLIDNAGNVRRLPLTCVFGLEVDDHERGYYFDGKKIPQTYLNKIDVANRSMHYNGNLEALFPQ